MVIVNLKQNIFAIKGIKIARNSSVVIYLSRPSCIYFSLKSLEWQVVCAIEVFVNTEIAG